MWLVNKRVKLSIVDMNISARSFPLFLDLFHFHSFFQLVTRPDVVEMHDVTARDPKLLVHLKATRNTVPVPRHWCFKRKYLQGKKNSIHIFYSL